MAPEQVNSTGLYKPAISSDIYGLGGILYAILHGQPPNSGGSRPAVRILDALVKRNGPPEPGAFHARTVRWPVLAAQLEQVCLKTLEFDPSNRHSSVEAFVEDIERVLTHWSSG